MKRDISMLFGNRVALSVVEEEYKGILVKAPTEEKMHVLARVAAKGDKVTQDIKVGDILFWQTNSMIQAHNRYQFDKANPLFILMTGDMVARVKNRTVDRENFQVIGDWCLVRRVVVQPSKLIFVPDTAVDANQDSIVQWILEQKGDTVDCEMGLGQEVIIDRTRANPIQLGEERFAYIHKNFVIGTVG